MSQVYKLKASGDQYNYAFYFTCKLFLGLRLKKKKIK